MTTILNGKLYADIIIEQLKTKVEKEQKKPKLAVILVGNNPASEIYVRNKQKKAQYIGFESVVITLENNISEENLLEQIYILNEDTNINAILVQLPLPQHIQTKKITEAIDPIKDVDGFTSYNFGRLILGYKPSSIPCTPKGIIKLLKYYNIDMAGKNTVVIGRSNIVGKPVSILLEQENATVTVAHSHTNNLKDLTLHADILISAIGKAKFITSEFIKNNSVIIDVGINRTENGLCGDVDYENVYKKAAFITPVPGGIGPMTIAMLMENTFELFKLQQNYLVL